MPITLPALPYPSDALAPHLTKETLDFHHGKHHASYVAKLNDAIKADASLSGKSLEDLVRTQKGAVFNNAAQIYNHNVYWQSLSPSGGGDPSGPVAKAIDEAFGSFADFKSKFSEVAAGHFGSGWAWLVKDDGGKLAIRDTHDAHTPITHGCTPLLTCDVWEHAYYIDYRNARPRYIEAWWSLVNWDFANSSLAGA